MSKTQAISPVTLTREELYALVWAEPMSHLCKRFGISDQGLAKICKRLDVPRPRQGHWNKIAAGKATETILLPPAKDRVEQSAAIRPSVPQDDPPPETKQKLDEARSNIGHVQIAERLLKPHPIIAGWIATRDRQVKARERDYRRGSSHAFVRAFTDQERRRLRLLDGLIKALEANGASVTKGERRQLAAKSGGETIEFQLRIKLRQVRRPVNDTDPSWMRRSGESHVLELQETEAQLLEIDNYLPDGLRRTWQDTRTKSLETMMDDIAATMLAAFPLLAEQRKKREEAERQRIANEQRRYELEQQRKLERNRFRRFLEHADHWREADLARQFTAAMRATITDAGETIDGRSAAEWLDWADAYANKLDPLSDPRRVFVSVAEVHNWTYRD
jgi:hypothetical protein